MSAECPCLCGHPLHFGAPCETCGCRRAAPDYVAGARAGGEVLSDAREAILRAWQTDVGAQLGYAGPAAPGRTRATNEREVECEYCQGTFRSVRRHCRTCSSACKQAVSVACKHATDADVPTPLYRRDAYSRERFLATGYGLVTATEAHEHDLRVRRLRRRKRAA